MNYDTKSSLINWAVSIEHSQTDIDAKLERLALPAVAPAQDSRV